MNCICGKFEPRTTTSGMYSHITCKNCGRTKPTTDKQLAIDLASFRTLEKLGYKYNGGEYWKPPLSTIGATKPVFTQAMKEAGEMPSVGMECSVYEINQDETHDKAIIKYISKSTCVYEVKTGDLKGEYSQYPVSLKFKPIDIRTDREKALDGLRWNGEGLTAKACVLALDLIMNGKVHGVTFTGSK